MFFSAVCKIILYNLGDPSCCVEFWDVVVLTTSDAAQQSVYELEISDKLEHKQLPMRTKYHVIHDPPGCKIGSGKSKTKMRLE